MRLSDDEAFDLKDECASLFVYDAMYVPRCIVRKKLTLLKQLGRVSHSSPQDLIHH